MKDLRLETSGFGGSPDRNQFHVAIAFTHKLGDFGGAYSEKLVEFGKPMP
jgi:hypothetical protein